MRTFFDPIPDHRLNQEIWSTPLAGICFWRFLKILKVCSRPKFAPDSKSGLRSGRGCSEVNLYILKFSTPARAAVAEKRKRTRKMSVSENGIECTVPLRIYLGTIDSRILVTYSCTCYYKGWKRALKNSAFWLGTAEKRLDLTSYMSCTNDKGRDSRWPTPSAFVQLI